MSECPPHNPVGWFEIYVSDLGRARAFYESVFRLSLKELPEAPVEMVAFPQAGCEERLPGACGALVRMDGFESGKNSVLVYFSCADCADEASRVEPAGGSVVKPKFPIGPYGHIALVKDTEGNLIGLHSCV